MKIKTYSALLIALTAIIAFGCEKTEIKTSPLASISVSNAVNGGGTLTLNTSTQTVANSAFANWAINAGSSQVKLYTNTTPQVVYFDQVITAQDGDYYSLFLGGASASAVDAVLVKDTYRNYTDSLFGVRFVNLLPGGPTININVTGGPTASEVANLAYKDASVFKSYKGDYKNATWTYEIRDASTNALLLSYGFRPAAAGTLPANPIPRFHNVSLVLKGTPASPSVLRTNHY